ncbi:cell wall-active antibiotics response protein LiaF [Pontibacillus sp. HMF3514]|uniref:cell wall-active antibiotics response protein LiaF n=1 Tax=Pontibacillus sp. HMF3514 TaxID=2692425 RepID=UPI00131FB24F|nr:cell wall-active antibiotics response protein LiaF [Pontibacillus sp. HMF3514]QHE51355.1 hypothetical protein GS400_04605 [Pontibacillus sp. HMF3514]
MRNFSVSKIVVAFVFIAIGVFLILANLDVISLEMNDAFIFIYPLLFVLIGLKLVFDGIRGDGDGWPVGAFLVVFGGLLILDRFDIISFQFGDIWSLWPIILVFIGISMFKPKRKSKHVEITTETDNEDEGEDQPKKNRKKKRNFTVGDHSFNEQNWKVEPMDLWNAIGDYHIDFTKAFIPEKDTSIAISGVIGDVKILMPENVAFRVDARIKTGDIKVLDEKSEGINRKLSYQTPDYDEATRKITLDIDFKIGDIRVDKV